MSTAKNYNSSEANMMRLRMLEKTIEVLRANSGGLTVKQMSFEVHKSATCTRQYLQDLLAGGIVERIKQRVGKNGTEMLYFVVASEEEFKDFLSKNTTAKIIAARLSADHARHFHIQKDDEFRPVQIPRPKAFYDQLALPVEFFARTAA